MKKLSVVGAGLSGMLAVHLFNNQSDFEIECIDNNSGKQNVGISSTLDLYLYLKYCSNINYKDIEKFNAWHKTGVSKEGFGDSNYFQSFDLANISCQFNSLDLINYLQSINKNIKYTDTLDKNSDFIIDATNKPKDITNVTMPVNTILGFKLSWEYPTFDYTRLIARPFGYISIMPTKKYKFVTYVYNNKFNTSEDIISDLLDLGYKVNDYQNWSFNSYYLNKPLQKNKLYTGNSAFFLEPFEATSLGSAIKLNVAAYELWTKQSPVDRHIEYLEYVQECQEMIYIHYLAGSIWDTPFWNNAQMLAKKFFANNMSKEFKTRLEKINKPWINELRPSYFYDFNMFKYNLNNLNITKQLLDCL